MKLQFSQQIFKHPQIPNFMKIRTVAAKLLHADGWTERHNEANIHRT
jgi:hypothetical protein